ncbi:MAG: hypothetical protein FJY73_03400 [Candidatus Eisenbacteria bacterium]|nr:hypothetical protein [Candidatus Eisenbacteria bacterium]
MSPMRNSWNPSDPTHRDDAFANPGGATPPTAVLIDGSALYLVSRALYEGRSLDYRGFIRLLCEEVEGVREPDPRGKEGLWVMWTSASSQNAGQMRFLEFAENDLHWEVRRFAPIESFVVEPAGVLGFSEDGKVAPRLVRFDAGIAFAIGRLADSYRIAVVSDSFALSEPLLRTAQIARRRGGGHRAPVLAFFGRGLDARWQRVLRAEGEDGLRFLDLDDFEEGLFGFGRVVRPRPAREEDAPIY